MANWDNLSTKQVQEDMELRFDLGMVEGYEGIAAGGSDEEMRQQEARRQKAEAAIAKFFREFSPFQRGYIYGYLTRLSD